MHKVNIMNDIYCLQESFSTSYFEYTVKLFFTKWRQLNDSKVNDFLDYFSDYWVHGKKKKEKPEEFDIIPNSGWYEGIAIRTPSTNNALEATNNVIKTHHSLRSRLPLGHYLNNAVSMLNHWSVDCVTIKPFKDEIDISIDTWTLAYNWMLKKGQILQLNDDMYPNSFIVCRNVYNDLVTDFHSLIKSVNLEHHDFDSITNVVDHVFMVQFNQYNLMFSTYSSCSFYLKTHLCIHIISVAVTMNVVKIPNHCKLEIVIGLKPKRGRISNACKSLKRN